MKTLIVIAMLSGLLGTTALNAPPLAEGPGEGAEAPKVIEQAFNPGPAFLTIDITLDPLGQPLGAYQFEMTSPDTSFTVVGVEAGEHAAFDHGRPPYFDPIAQRDQTDRLILAEYAKPDLKADQLPTQAVRVATVHVMVTLTDDEAPEPLIQLTLTAAGNADGQRIDAKASYSFRTPERPE